ncbi:hypothetical protein C8R42DRAFT_666183 [Lentinula raphanica]|nr:hypothetical protein C8R42DRAFT_666183 [Lentinula raphanica]
MCSELRGDTHCLVSLLGLLARMATNENELRFGASMRITRRTSTPLVFRCLACHSNQGQKGKDWWMSQSTAGRSLFIHTNRAAFPFPTCHTYTQINNADKALQARLLTNSHQ